MYAKLSSDKWTDRKSGLEDLIEHFDVFIKRDRAAEAYNQVVTSYSYTEKNQACVVKHLKVYELLASVDDFRLDNPDKMVAYTLEKYMDKQCETQAYQTFIAFLRRNNNEEFNHTMQLLLTRGGYYNATAMKSHNHLQRRLRLCDKITTVMKSEILTADQQKDLLGRYYPIDTIMDKLNSALVHPNQQVRQSAQLLAFDMIQTLGWDEMKLQLVHTDRKGLLPLKELVPELEQFLTQRKTLSIQEEPEPVVIEPP